MAAPKPVGAAGGGLTPEAIKTSEVFWRVLIAIVVVIVVSRLVGMLFQRINQPQVVGEIIAGVMLGPSLLGAIAPGISHTLFSKNVLPFIDVLAEVGLIFFMFLIGLELDVRLLKGRGQAAFTVSQVSIIVPFLLGVGTALALFTELGSNKGKFLPFALFLGASMSITAFPVLARILTERNLYKTKLGAVILTCAAVDDITAWCMLAVVVAVARAKGPASALVTIGLSAVFIVFMIVCVRPLLARIATYHEDRGHLPGAMLALIFVGILVSALATDRIGIHAIFGAFLFGAIMPQRSEFIRELIGKLEDFAVVFLLPLFFAYTGLRTKIGLIGTDPKLWALCGLILLVAVLGKWGGSSLTARVVGMPWRESMALGVLMNTRGLTELVILNIGLDLGVIPPTLFAMLVIMALVTTFMATPLLSLFYRREQLEQMAREEGGLDEDEEGPRRWQIVVPLSSDTRSADLVHTAMRLARDREEAAQIVLLRAVRFPGSGFGGVRSQDAMVSRANANLRQLVQLVEGAGYAAVPLVVVTSSVADAIVNVVRERQPDLVLLGWHRSLFGRRLFSGTVGDVIRRAECDVAVLVDPAHKGLALKRDAKIVVPYGGGFHEDVGIDLALRLAEASSANVTLVGPNDDEGAHDLAERAARAYEETGVWTTAEPVAGDVISCVVERARDAELVVLGVSDTWITDQNSLGPLRDVVAARSAVPMLLVRRHGQRGGRGPSRWFRRQKEWMDEANTGEAEGVHPEAAVP